MNSDRPVALTTQLLLLSKEMPGGGPNVAALVGGCPRMAIAGEAVVVVLELAVQRVFDGRAVHCGSNCRQPWSVRSFIASSSRELRMIFNQLLIVDSIPVGERNTARALHQDVALRAQVFPGGPDVLYRRVESKAAQSSAH